jgi:hypothetical protein
MHEYIRAYARFAPKFKYFEPKFEFTAGTAGLPVTVTGSPARRFGN